MKLKNFLAVAAIVALTACGTPYRATDTGVIVVSDRTQRAFYDQYPNTSNVAWSYYDPTVVILNDWELTGWHTLTTSDYVVRFDMDGENYYAWYDSHGTWVGTAYVVTDYNTLPAYVTNSLSNRYPSYTIGSVNREHYKDRILYEVTMKNGDSKVVLLVDPDGTIVKEKVKS